MLENSKHHLPKTNKQTNPQKPTNQTKKPITLSPGFNTGSFLVPSLLSSV